MNSVSTIRLTILLAIVVTTGCSEQNQPIKTPIPNNQQAQLKKVVPPKNQQTPRDTLVRFQESIEKKDELMFNACYEENLPPDLLKSDFRGNIKMAELKSKILSVYGDEGNDYFADSPEEDINIQLICKVEDDQWWKTIEIIIETDIANYEAPTVGEMKMIKQNGAWRIIHPFAKVFLDNPDQAEKINLRLVSAFDHVINNAHPDKSYVELKREMTEIITGRKQK
ncbi:MAG: hypothetical protein COA78_24455 [Blastopirellula sp.]|nr:MAG: hypothetical protein COA78_24455 [Blastopirellula sp.]